MDEEQTAKALANAQSGELSRYVGRYLHQEGTGIVLDISLRDGVLHMHAPGTPAEVLTCKGADAFDAGEQRVEFTATRDGVPLSLTIGPQSNLSATEVFARIAPFVPSGSAWSETIDLGRICLCLPANPRKVTRELYERLGFESQDGSTMSQGFTTLAFFDFLDGMLINFRGANVTTVATELARRGIAPMASDQTGGLVPLTLTAIPPHATAQQLPRAFPLRLRQAAHAAQSLAFLCENPAAVSAAIRDRAVTVVETAEGPGFVDSDGRTVVLLQA